jgi:uncharacterized protein (DUF983 family)
MAASLQTSPVPQAPEPKQTAPLVAEALAIPAHAYLARLAALHDEAAETAYLANLLGRAPWAAGALAIAMAAATAYSAQSASWTALGVWLVLAGIGAVAIMRAYGEAIDAPFDRPSLKLFARNFAAILVYAGTAWASGLFLVIPSDVGVIGSVVFVSLLPAVLATIVRTRDLAFCFLAPATAMGAFCALMRGADGPAILGILAAGLVIAGATFFSERLRIPVLRALPG